MTGRQAKQYACAWIAADLLGHDSVQFCDNPQDNVRVAAAYNDIIDEMLRRGGQYADEPGIGPQRQQQFYHDHMERRL